MVHDHPVSPVVFVPATRPMMSYTYSVTTGAFVVFEVLAAWVGLVDDFIAPNCRTPPTAHTPAGAVSRSA